MTMQNYHDTMADVLANGQFKPDRTGVGTISSVGHMLKYDLREAFPAVTSKKLAFRSVVGELLGFFRGYRSAAQFRALGCKVWDQNANETKSWVNNPYRLKHDDLGRIYGLQWTDWKSYREARNQHELECAEAAGYKIIGTLPFDSDGRPQGWILYKSINQLEDALKMLILDPYSRRIRITGWRLDEIDMQALPSCHAEYQFIKLPDGRLDATLAIRSNDLFLGHPFNAASFALFTHIMARLSGCTPGICTVFISDAHIYSNHTDAVKEQLQREHMPAPKLILSDRIRKIENLDEIRGVFERIEPEDISLDGYQSHPPLRAPMAA